MLWKPSWTIKFGKTMNRLVQQAVILLSLLALSLEGRAQFVTLEGRNFMVNGQAFYPRVLNYSISTVGNNFGTTDPAALYCSPASVYDKSVTSLFECNEEGACNLQLQEHFAKVVEMGFNTIRIGIGPHMRKEGSTFYYGLQVNWNTTDWTPDPTWTLDMQVPGFTDPLSLRYFELLRNLLDQADAAGLKVILICAEDQGGRLDPQQLHPAYNDAAAALYASFLGRLAMELQGHPALLAYDLWNEPVWTNWNNMMSWTKSQVCSFTWTWYDALKDNDPDHLITLGGANIDDLRTWDPSAMKLDFYSPHTYPQPWDLDGYSFPAALARVKQELYWLARTCPMPYLVGETGFSAEDDGDDHWDDPNGANHHLLPDPAYHQMPWMHGSEAQQASYAQQTMDATRNYFGSGYSWWEFQNKRFANTQSSPGEYRENFFGPLKYGDGTTPWFDKQVVSTFENYTLPPSPAALPPPPANYGNQYNFNGVTIGDWTIREADNDPVADAVAVAKYHYFHIAGPNQDEENVTLALSNRFLTNSAGEVVVKGSPSRSGYYMNWVELWTHIPGAATIYYPNLDATPWPGSTVYVDRDHMEFDAVFDEIDVPIGADDRFFGWHSVITTDGIVHGNGSSGGEAEIAARSSVHLTNEFHAAQGSEVHIHLKSTFPDCGSTAYWLPISGNHDAEPAVAYGTKIKPATVQLQFEPHTGFDLALYPNPGKDQISISGHSGPASYTVHDCNGSLVDAGQLSDAHATIAVGHLAPGEYTITLTIPGNSQAHTLKFTLLP
ncbi:MAG: cellulase family glycosylhydrolase [Flavobacteriales bacterium]|nr:cellulase family glycosylhydrolase [Flavobacteriales bacterium]